LNYQMDYSVILAMLRTESEIIVSIEEGYIYL